MSTLEKIVDRGNRGDDNWITCADGFKLSVLAKAGAYCTPRPAFSDMYLPNLHEVPATYPGPFTNLEVGFPSERPEPWDSEKGWAEYAENAGDPTGTVYGYVPVQMVRALIAAHGGES